MACRSAGNAAQRLLGRLKLELLRPEVIDYAVTEFGPQLRTALARTSTSATVVATNPIPSPSAFFESEVMCSVGSQEPTIIPSIQPIKTDANAIELKRKGLIAHGL
jgi:hypothetical protein